MDPKDLAALAGDIKTKLDAVGERLSDEAITARINAAVADLASRQDGPFSRRALFGGSDPRLAGSKYGRKGMSVADIEFLHSTLSAAKVVGRSKAGPSADLENAFNAISEGKYEDVVSAQVADLAQVEQMFADGALNQRGFAQATAAIEQSYRKRAMDTAESGYGSQLVGAQYIGELWAGARAEARIMPLLTSFPMAAPTVYMPVEADLPEMTFVAENTSASASNYSTVKTGSNRVQVDAKKFIIHQVWSGEMEEDSLIPFVPFLRGQQVRSLAHYTDSVILNGDTTNAGTGNINLDDADPADTKHYLALDGIRHAALVDATGQGTSAGATITYDAMVNLRKLGLDTTYFHDWFHPTNPEDAVFLVNPDLADELAKLDEVITVDKYGPLATVLTGEVARIGRNPLIATISMSKTEADGKVSTTPGNNTKHQAVLFNRRGIVLGTRRALQVEVERIPATDQNRIILSTRFGLGRFSPTGAASGIKHIAVLYNIS
jgi:HK97 family phage major capsid protein